MLKEAMSTILTEGVDWGWIPGVDRPSLYKPGAEKVCTMFRIDPQFRCIDKVLDGDLIMYDYDCTLYDIDSGKRLASYRGAANSREERYYWRKVWNRGEWEEYPEERRRVKRKYNRKGEVEEEWLQVRLNPWEIQNTIMKQACKRALVGAVLVGTCASSVFTQDVEEMPEGSIEGQRGRPRGRFKPKPAENAVAADPGKDVAGSIADGMVRFLHVLCGKAGYKTASDKWDYTVQFMNALSIDPTAFQSTDPNDPFKGLSFNAGRKIIDKMQEVRQAEDKK